MSRVFCGSLCPNSSWKVPQRNIWRCLYWSTGSESTLLSSPWLIYNFPLNWPASWNNSAVVYRPTRRKGVRCRLVNWGESMWNFLLWWILVAIFQMKSLFCRRKKRLENPFYKLHLVTSKLFLIGLLQTLQSFIVFHFQTYFYCYPVISV